MKSNRQVPNGTSDGVRGGDNIPLIDCFYKIISLQKTKEAANLAADSF